MKVFLSHSTKDKDFVLELDAGIKGANIETWVCEVDILNGDDFVEQIEKGLTECDLTLLIWSPEAAHSPWTGKEWRSVLGREIEESRTRLGFLLLRDADVPELLRTKHRIDGRENHAKAIEEALQWITRMRDMRKYAESKAASYLLDYEPEGFVGRTEYFESLHTALVEKPGKFLLHGGPGTGKSTLALKWAWRTQGAFDAAVFQHCGDRTAKEIGSELAERLHLDVKELPPDQQITAVKSWLSERRALFVLDDVWNQDVRELVPGPPVSVLFTSRQRSLPWISASQTSEVKSFAKEESESLFRIYLGEETSTKHRDALHQFASKVEGLPIAIAVGASLLREEIAPFDEAAHNLHLEQLRNETHDVSRLLQRVVDSRSEPEQRLLQAMSVCHPKGFWLPLVAQIAELEEKDAQQAAKGLHRISLLTIVDRDRHRFRLHALLREQLRRSTSLDELKEKHADQLEALFNDWQARWQDCRQCLSELIPAIQLAWTRGLNDRGNALLNSGFEAAYRIGELVSAYEIAKHGQAYYEELGNRPALLASYCNQAVILTDWGMLEEAMALLKKQETISLALGNKDGLPQSYINQALILKTWGKLEEAMVLLKKAEAICLELGKKDDLQTSYGNQALVLQDWGKLEEAMELHKKAEAICLEFGNKNSLEMGYTNQALILKTWGKLEESMELHRKVEAICLELGHKNGLQISYGNQAGILRDLGQLEEAMQLLMKQEGICLELGKRNSLQNCYGNWATILQDRGKLDEAMVLLKKQETICLELGNKNGLQISYGNQAGILRQSGKLDEAMELHKKEEAICLELDNKGALQACYGNQALILQDWGKLEEAIDFHKKQEAICLKLDNKGTLQACYGKQAFIHRQWGQLEEALQLLKKEEAICLELDNKGALQACYGNQALILQDWGKLEEAMALLKKQEAICLELDTKDDLQISYGNQALILQDWGKLDEAIALLKKQEAISLELGSKDGLQISYGNQAIILRDLGQLEEAMQLLKKQEAICLEFGNKDDLQISYGNQAIILRDRGQLEEAMALIKKQEAISLELGNKDGLQISYGNQANILQVWGKLEEAMELLKKQEAICLELGSKNGLGYCYWNWGLLAREMNDPQTGREKLQAAIKIFTKLNMKRERDAVQAELRTSD